MELSAKHAADPAAQWIIANSRVEAIHKLRH